MCGIDRFYSGMSEIEKPPHWAVIFVYFFWLVLLLLHSAIESKQASFGIRSQIIPQPPNETYLTFQLNTIHSGGLYYSLIFF